VLLRASMDQSAFYQPSVAPVSSAIINFGPGPWDGVVPKAAPWLPLPRDLARKAAFQQATSVFGPLAFDRGVAPPPPTTTLTVTIAAGTVDSGASNAFFMNDISFVPPDTPSLYSRLLGNPTNVGNGPNAAPGEVGFNVQNYTTGSVVDVIINNHDGGQHPIHLHGAFFTVMAQGDENAGDYAGQPLEALVLRDVHTIPANSYIVLRVPIFNTMPMFLHCHIEPHLGVGLGMVMNSLAVGRG
jgi:FtsP/CotA-like multicopper oxidase with cupredoxin domain